MFNLAGTSQALPLPKERTGFDPTVFLFVLKEKRWVVYWMQHGRFTLISSG